MKKIILIALLCSLAVAAVTYQQIHNGQTWTILNDTLGANDTIISDSYFVYRPSVDLAYISIFVATTDSIDIEFQGSLRADTTTWGWTALQTDTTTAGTTAYNLNLDTLTFYDIVRCQLIALDDSLKIPEVYMVTKP